MDTNLNLGTQQPNVNVANQPNVPTVNQGFALNNNALEALIDQFQTRTYNRESIYTPIEELVHIGIINIDPNGKFHSITANDDGKYSLKIDIIKADSNGNPYSEKSVYYDCHSSCTDDEIANSVSWKLYICQAQRSFKGYKLDNGKIMSVEDYQARKAVDPLLPSPTSAVNVDQGARKVYALPANRVVS